MNLAFAVFCFACLALVLLLWQWWRQSRQAALEANRPGHEHRPAHEPDFTDISIAANPIVAGPPPLPHYMPDRGDRSYMPLQSCPPGLTCPYCRSHIIGSGFNPMTTGGIVMMVSGIVLGFIGLLFFLAAPFLVSVLGFLLGCMGIAFVLGCTWMRELRYRCQNCQKTF